MFLSSHPPRSFHLIPPSPGWILLPPPTVIGILTNNCHKRPRLIPVHNQRELRSHGVKMFESELRCHAASSARGTRKQLMNPPPRNLIILKTRLILKCQQTTKPEQLLSNASGKRTVSHRHPFLAEVCSPENPDRSSMYGESRGVSPFFLPPKLKAATRRAPSVPN